jgi:hypothetical protein
MSNPITIGLSGKKRAGKNFVANVIQKELEDRMFCVEQRAFADPLKFHIKTLLAGSFSRMHEDMESLQVPRYRRVLAYAHVLLLALDIRSFRRDESGKLRFLLQRYGTNVMRRWAGRDFWVLLSTRVPSEADVIIYTDVRFPNEASVCDIMVRVQGPGEIEGTKDGHASENPDSLTCDYWIDNSIRGKIPQVHGLMREVRKYYSANDSR